MNAGRDYTLDLAQGCDMLTEFHRSPTRCFDREGDGETKAGEAGAEFDIFHRTSLFRGL